MAYKGLRSLGIYQQSLTSNGNFRFTTNYQTKNKKSIEVFITNYKPKNEQIKIF